MQVGELRDRLLGRVEEVAASGDELATAQVTSYARAVLISMALQPADIDIEVEELTVGTRTAALIMRRHPEYVRFLIRSKELRATKTNGEFRIPLPEVVRSMEIGAQSDLAEDPVGGYGVGMSGVIRPWPPQSRRSSGGESGETD